VLERIALRGDLLDEVAAQAAAAGTDFDAAFSRVLARGLIRRLESDLAPLLDGPSDAATPLPSGKGATSELSRQTLAERHPTARRPVKGAGGACPQAR
jgi:hypothetical protein